MAADYTLTTTVQSSGKDLLQLQKVALPVTSWEVTYSAQKFEQNISVLAFRPSISGAGGEGGGGGGGGESTRPTAGMLYPRRQC